MGKEGANGCDKGGNEIVSQKGYRNLDSAA